MNSTWIKIAIAYTAGMITYAVFESHEVLEKVDKIAMMSTDTSATDAIDLETSCACENKARYDVDPKERSENIPIDKIEACRAMVNGEGPTIPEGKKGAWFSKLTLDLMFCHAPEANGIFVYKATMEGPTKEKEETFVIEAARTNKINTEDDGTSYIYYSRTLCPTICGRCAD